jgi:hypothetical protein
MDARLVPIRTTTSRSASDFWCRARLPGQVDDHDRGRVVSNPPLGPAPYDDLPFAFRDSDFGVKRLHLGNVQTHVFLQALIRIVQYSA